MSGNQARAPWCEAPVRARRKRFGGVTLALLASLMQVPSVESAPSILSTSPATQTIGAALSSEISVRFAAPLQINTVTDDAVLLHSSMQGRLTGTASWDGAQNELTFVPDRSFIPGERITVTLTKNLLDLGGQSLPNGHTFQFTTWTAPTPDRAYVTEPVAPSIGSIAFTATVADLDADGLPDMIFSNVVSDSLTIFSSDGTGSFTAWAPIPTDNMPRHVTVADVNGDGEQDLLCCSAAASRLLVFLNRGDGSFEPYVGHEVSDSPYGVFLGDFDADGDLDAVTANFVGHNVSVLENFGNATFAPAVDYAIPGIEPAPVFVDGADLDGDGDLDLVTANSGTGDLGVLLNNGDGTFTVQPATYPVGEQPQLVALGDLNGDGIPDAVVVNTLSGTVSSLLGVGDGTFQPRVNTPQLGVFPHGLQLVDLDGDFDLDAVVPLRGANGWVPLWNDGTGAFVRGQLYLGGIHCHTIGAADWDLDGDIDVMAGFAISKDAFHYRSVSVPVIDATLPIANAAGVHVSSPIDLWFNTDLSAASVDPAGFSVFGSASGPAILSVEWFPAGNRLRLTPASPFTPGEVVSVTALGDGSVVSQDGLTFSGFSFEFTTTGNPQGATFTVEPPIALPALDPTAFAAADFDGDGRTDLAVAGFLSDDITLLLSADGLPHVSSIVPVGDGPIAIWAADLDGNGEIDIATADVISGSVDILLNSGGTFLPTTSLQLGGTPFEIIGADFDRDGDVDLAVALLSPNSVEIHWNDGTGLSGSFTMIPIAGPPVDLASADLDGDGTIDLAVLDGSTGAVRLFTFDGTEFVAAGIVPGAGATEILLRDVNQDGWVDLVTAGHVDAGLAVALNLGNDADSMPEFGPASSVGSIQVPRGLVGTDLNGDGLLDLACVGSGNATQVVYLAVGGGAFAPALTVGVGESPYDLAVGDWNGDGRVDLATLNRGSGDLSLLIEPQATGANGVSGPIAAGLLGIAPNPFRTELGVSLGLGRAGLVSVRVFDVRGRAVRTIGGSVLSAGQHRLTWDGRGRDGRRVAAGVYFLRIEAAGELWSRKVLHLK